MERLSNKNPCNKCNVDRQIGNPYRWQCECDRCGKPTKWREECVNKLKYYEDLEEQGLLIRIPVKKVYYILDRNTEYATVMSRDTRSLCLYEIEGIDKKGYYWSTQEKAEEVLKKMNGTGE